jgi:uncharacterized Tic20 family protein
VSLPVGFVVALPALVEIILATLAATRGEDLRYPMCIRIVR